MYSFRNDYSELAHPYILELVNNYNKQQNNGYGLDEHCNKAKCLIKKQLQDEVDIHFLVGGTSCNKIFISHVLKPYEAVISPISGHINIHEAGAIEATGHRIIEVSGNNGKITVDEIIAVCEEYGNEHMVVPKLVFISNATEVGSIYTKKELEDISKICKKYNLLLYLDGARIGVALTSHTNDITFTDLTKLTDAFYIGGTKNGAMLGEALVINNKKISERFRNSIKQKGGLLAKGYLIGLQFEALFTDNLFFKLAKHANETAQYLKRGLEKSDVEFYSDSPTNQQFIRLDNEIVEELKINYEFEIWEKSKNKTVIRLVTSWATDYKAIDIFINDLNKLLKRGPNNEF